MIKRPPTLAVSSLLENIKRIARESVSEDVPAFARGVVTTVTNDSGTLRIKLKRLGAVAEDDVYYTILNSYVPRVNDTVLCARFGRTLIVLGAMKSARVDPYYVSGARTGTGAEESIAHGFGVVPRHVFVSLTTGTTGATITEGTHDATNLKVTVTNGAGYRIMAFI